MNFPGPTALDQDAVSASGRLRSRTELLVHLLGDDSRIVQRNVSQALRCAGRAALPSLLRATRGADPVVRARSRRLVSGLWRERAWRRLCGYVLGRKVELEPALFLLAAYQSPGLSMLPYRTALARLGDALAEAIADKSADGSRARELGRLLGRELCFRGDRQDYHHPANASLALVIERKRGLPLTLAALYRAVAKRAGLRAELLPVPGHVLLLVFDGSQRVILDPFDAGRPLSLKDCHHYLKQHGLPVRREYFEPASDLQMFLRQLGNVWRSAKERKWQTEVRQLGLLRKLLESRAFRTHRLPR